MDVEQHLVVELLLLDDDGVEPDRDDDAEIVDLVLRDVAVAHRVEHAVGGRRLHGAHQDVGVARVLDRDLAHHEGRRAHHDVGVEDRQHARVALDLVAQQRAEGGAHRAVHLADRHLRLRGRSRRSAGYQCLAYAHVDLVAHCLLL